MVAPLWPSSNMMVLSHLHKWLLREDMMFWMASSIQLGPQGGGPGSLLSKYTLWQRSRISFWKVWCPAIWTVGISASRYGGGRASWQINLSASFCPSLAACMNILWRMMGVVWTFNIPLRVLIQE